MAVYQRVSYEISRRFPHVESTVKTSGIPDLVSEPVAHVVFGYAKRGVDPGKKCCNNPEKGGFHGKMMVFMRNHGETKRGRIWEHHL